VGKLCSLARVTVLLTGNPIDDDAGTAMGAAVFSACAPPPILRSTTSGADGGVLNAQGAPLTGPDELLIAAGGRFSQPHVEWLETVGTAPILDDVASATFTWSRRADGAVLVAAPIEVFDGGRDYFAVELVRSAPLGALSLLAQGAFQAGTRAAAWYFVNRVLPQLSTFGNAWYVVEWTDTNADGLPDPGDSYVTLATGN
jgi:hypothetical protein